ncbi:MAG TPA: histidine kinase, partial [Chloroflexota bacterium]
MRIATSWLSFDDVTADGRLLTAAGLALPASVWLLGLLAPPKGGLTLSYLLSYSALIVLLVFVDRTLPPASAPVGKRLVWVVTELILSLLIVGVLGNLSRSALIYLLPASRTLLLFKGRPGLALSLLVWPLFSLDVLASIGLDHSGELPNYLTLMLAPYIVAVVFTRATLRQAGDRQRLQALYDQLQQAHTELQALNAKVRETAVTQERNRLAREIHDSIAHYLT